MYWLHERGHIYKGSFRDKYIVLSQIKNDVIMLKCVGLIGISEVFILCVTCRDRLTPIQCVSI